MKNQDELPLFAPVPPPLAVSYGSGVDSTAMLIALHQRGIRPDLIVFADTGNELTTTYDYLKIMSEWLASVGFPPIVTVRAARPRSGDRSLGDALLRTSVLPALAYGMHQCSLVWKIEPQNRYLRSVYGWSSRSASWRDGYPYITKAIGYDAGIRDRARAGKAHGKDSPGFRNWYPLIDYEITRDDCAKLILDAGLPLPNKSACSFCPARKKEEINDLAMSEPHLLREAIEIEDRAIQRGLTSIKGLGRRWSWRSYIENEAPSDVKMAASIPAAKLPVAIDAA